MNTDRLKPMLFSVIKKYNAGMFAKDVVSGIIVAIIALPLIANTYISCPKVSNIEANNLSF